MLILNGKCYFNNSLDQTDKRRVCRLALIGGEIKCYHYDCKFTEKR